MSLVSGCTALHWDVFIYSGNMRLDRLVLLYMLFSLLNGDIQKSMEYKEKAKELELIVSSIDNNYDIFSNGLLRWGIRMKLW